MGLFRKKKKEEAVEVREETPAVSSGIPGEVIAAISAAVYCMFGEGARVMSVRRQRQTTAEIRKVCLEHGRSVGEYQTFLLI